MSKIVAGVVAVGTLVGLLAVAPATVAAHAELESSTPGSGEMLTGPPSEISLVFTENVGEPAALEVLGTEGSALPGGGLEVIDDTMRRTYDPSVFPPGVYTISYQVTSADGHPIAGNLTFMVHAAGEAPMDPGTVASASGDSDGTSPTVVMLLVVTLVLALAGVLLATKRLIARPDDAPTS